MMTQSELFLMMTVTGRDRLPDFITLYRDKGIDIHLISLGYGTANQQILKYLALNNTEKAVCFSIVTGRKWLEVKRAMSVRLRIEAPGVGIAYVIPLSSIGGKRELMFLTDGLGYQKGEETTLKGTEQELLIVIGNQGYSETIMDAARAAGARGGTVLHARGTGMQKAEQFLGISLGSEKDVIMIVTATEDKKAMMQSIMHEAGPGTKAGAIVFSIPVEDTAGMTLRPVSEDLVDEPVSDTEPGPVNPSDKPSEPEPESPYPTEPSDKPFEAGADSLYPVEPSDKPSESEPDNLYSAEASDKPVEIEPESSYPVGPSDKLSEAEPETVDDASVPPADEPVSGDAADSAAADNPFSARVESSEEEAVSDVNDSDMGVSSMNDNPADPGENPLMDGEVDDGAGI